MTHGQRTGSAVAALACLTVLATAGCMADADASAQEYGGPIIDKKARFEGVAAAHCPHGEKVDALLYVDSSASSAGLSADRLPIILANARITALCGGRLRIVAFSKSISETDVIYDQELDPGSGTATSKIIKADDFIRSINAAVKPALKKPNVDPRGTDVVAVLEDAAETLARPVTGAVLSRVVVITDGANTVGGRITKTTTKSEAGSLAESVDVPDLTGVAVLFTGIGLFGDKTPTSSYVEALKTYLQVICDRSTHSTCAAPTTHYTDR